MEDIFERNNGKRHVFTFKSTCRPLCNIGMHLITIEHAHAKILVSALECQVSWGDNYGEVVNHQCNLAYASKLGKWHYYACDTNTINGVVALQAIM